MKTTFNSIFFACALLFFTNSHAMLTCPTALFPRTVQRTALLSTARFSTSQPQVPPFSSPPFDPPDTQATRCKHTDNNNSGDLFGKKLDDKQEEPSLAYTHDDFSTQKELLEKISYSKEVERDLQKKYRRLYPIALTPPTCLLFASGPLSSTMSITPEMDIVGTAAEIGTPLVAVPALLHLIKTAHSIRRKLCEYTLNSKTVTKKADFD